MSRIRTATGRGARKRVSTQAEQGRLTEFVDFLATPDADWQREVRRRFIDRLDSELVRRLEREGRVRYLSAAADALDNPESVLCRALAKGPLGRISPIEHLLLEWIIANLLLPGIAHFDQAAMLLRVLDIYMAARSGRELDIRVCTTKLLETQREAAIEFAINTALDEAGL